MRTWSIVYCVILALGLIACDQPSRQQPTARQAGKDAYRATQDLKHDANEAARQLRDAGRQFHEGWDQAKHEDKPAHKQE